MSSCTISAHQVVFFVLTNTTIYSSSEPDMPPHAGLEEPRAPLNVDVPIDNLDLTPASSENPEPDSKLVPDIIVWRNVILMAALHLSSLYGIYLIPQAKLGTLVFGKSTILMRGVCRIVHKSLAHYR